MTDTLSVAGLKVLQLGPSIAGLFEVMDSADARDLLSSLIELEDWWLSAMLT